MKKIIAAICLLFSLLFPAQLFASEQFKENYSVRYEIQDNGDAVVTESVKTENLTDTYFSATYKSIIPTLRIKDVSAREVSRTLKTEVKEENGSTAIIVDFPEQIIGKGKVHNWTLKYTLPEFARKNGAIWQFTIPKLAEIKNLEQYNLVVSIPLSLGEPSQLAPLPITQKDVNDRTEYTFEKQQIEVSGITGLFGTTQNYTVNLNYQLQNDSLLPTIKSITIPGSGSYQEIMIDQITPRPENVLIDQNGNSNAFFHLDRRSALNITVQGKAKVDLEKSAIAVPSVELLQQLTTPNQIWDSNSPQVQEALKAALENNQNQSTIEKAERIFHYVINAIEKGDYAATNQFNNDSASSILTNPQNRFCTDYVNVMIAMLRAAQIPAEQLVGTVHPTDPKLPVCYRDKTLHTWLRFYDTQKGWVNADPAWGTIGGLSYFNYSDLDHVLISVITEPTQTERLNAQSQLTFFDAEFLPQYTLKSEILTPQEIIAGFPYEITFRISNTGNTVMPPGSFTISAKQLVLNPKNMTKGDGNYIYPAIPPFGYVDYVFTTKSPIAWQTFADELTIKTTQDQVMKPIQINSLFDSRFFAVIVFGLTFLMFGLYIAALYLHYRAKTVYEATVEVVEEIADKVHTAVSLPIIKIAASNTKNVIKSKKVKKQKFRKKKSKGK